MPSVRFFAIYYLLKEQQAFGGKIMTQKRVSIREIAELSGVSVATVSRVINNNGRFSETTRQKVMAVIREQGYETNAMAKGLRMHKSNTIGIVVPDLNNSFFADLVEKIEQQLFETGYSTIICDTARDPRKEAGYLKMLEAKLVDGLIVISGLKEFDSQQLSRHVPIVCIDRKPNTDIIKYIGSDHYKGAQLATEKLISAKTNPILLTGSRDSPSLIDRIKGYQDTLAKNGLQADNTSVIRLTEEEEQTPDTRRSALREILRELMTKTQPPIGIFAVSDTLAADVLIAAHSMFISVPSDLKVIGFDDAPIARYCYPELTTIRQNTDEIAVHATSYLVSAIQGKAEQNSSINKLVDVSLVNRSTV